MSTTPARGAGASPASDESRGEPAPPAAIELRQVTKQFGPVVAVDRVSLVVHAGEFLTLLGPSGCGKTTLLRLIAGFELPDAGAVLLGGNDVTVTPPHQRDVNQVFQSYALFPNLSARDNIAFGLRMGGMSARGIAERVEEMIALVSLGGCENRKPHQLSGGQRQRVALARALAPRPSVLLLDEPLSALDARLRQSMQLELKRLQRQIGTTFVLVTHDQEEALAMSDRIALIHAGHVEQIGRPEEIYARPATAFAAQFIGHANVLEAELATLGRTEMVARVAGGLELRIEVARWPAGATRANLSIRRERIRLSKTPTADVNCFEARVEMEMFKGALDGFVAVTEGGVRLHATAMKETAPREPIHVGDRVWCTIAQEDIIVVG